MKKLTADELTKLLGKISFFKAFTDEEKLRLAESESYVSTLTKNEYIIREGSTDHGLFILLKGDAYITKNALANVRLAELKPGAVFGEISFLAKHPRTTNVIADGNALVLRFDQLLLRQFGPELESKVKDQLMHVLIRRLDSLNQAIIKNIRYGHHMA